MGPPSTQFAIVIALQPSPRLLQLIFLRLEAAWNVHEISPAHAAYAVCDLSFVRENIQQEIVR